MDRQAAHAAMTRLLQFAVNVLVNSEEETTPPATKLRIGYMPRIAKWAAPSMYRAFAPRIILATKPD
jgi:hypothetical protein